MGVLISRFRKKKNAEELLEDLTNKIKNIEEFQACEQDRLRVRNRQFLVYSLLIYVLTILTYIIFDPEKGRKYIVFAILVTPIFIWFTRKLIIFYYKRKISRNKIQIEVYKKEKKKTLDDVMETETYKVAKRILEKYDTHGKKFTPPRISTPIPIPRPSSVSTPIQTSIIQTDVRRRTTQSRDAFFNDSGNMLVSTNKQPPSLVRPLLQNRGVFDRIMHRVVGDGPENRYALICKGCESHNGMALKEEFEYLAYQCAFCGHFNPARKQRPRILSNALEAPPPGFVATAVSENTFDSLDRPKLEITELEDSGNQSKDDERVSRKDENIEEVNKDDSEKGVESVLETLETLKVTTENNEKPISQEDSEENSKPPLDENCTVSETNQITSPASNVEESVQHTVPTETVQSTELGETDHSPMDVDEDESVVISRNIKRLSIDS